MTDLTKKENWTPELIYVHRSRLVVGIILGLSMGVPIGYLIASILL